MRTFCDFTFWISLAESFAETELQTKTEPHPKIEVTFFIWTQQIFERSLIA